MRITLDLPEYDASWHMTSPDPDTEGKVCGQCQEPIVDGTAVKLMPFGWLHADKCLQGAVERVQSEWMTERSAYLTAWLTVAQHVAKYPSRHSAATIRAVLQNVTLIAGWAAR